jgi:hypothetical protein
MSQYNKFLLVTVTVSLSLLLASPAKAEWYNSEGAIESGKACAYAGAVMAAGASVIMEKNVLKSGAIACGVAGASVGAYNYLSLPTETPTEKDIHEVEPTVQEQND